LNWHHESFDPVWAAFEDLDMIASFHSGTAAITNIVGIDRYQLYTMNSLCSHVIEGMLCLMDLTIGGVLERFPKLRVGIVETHVAWLPGWLALMDDLQPRHLEWLNLKNPLKMLPSEYFKRQCYITAFPDDPMLGTVIDLVGDDRIAISSDFPHKNSRRDMVAIFKELHSDLSEESQKKILSTNMFSMLGVDGVYPEPAMSAENAVSR
jgi:predicted TIM-barrel fold metal-dependent hydrolase